GDSIKLTPKLEYERTAEPRGTSGNELTKGEPVYFRKFAASMEGDYEAQAFKVELLLIYRQIRYEPVKIDGVENSQAFRASDGIGGRLTLLYKVGPALSALVEVVGDSTGNPHDAFCCLRDAHGFAVLAGLRFDPRGMFAGQAAIGYRWRYFEG